MPEQFCLNDIRPGQSARVIKNTADGSIRRRLLDLGLTEHTRIQCVGKSPSGDPAAFLIRGAVIAIRKKDGKEILIEEPLCTETSLCEKSIAIAGNPNVGKSTIFNGLTGMHQHTGNWPGKTVGSASGSFQTATHTYILTDIPGTYSLMAHSPEEEIARDFLCFGEIDAAIVVCDATCLERNLNLVLQTLELIPKCLVCVNLMDEARHRHIQVDLKKLSLALGTPVVGTTARKKQSLRTLTDALDNLVDMPCATALHPVTYAPPLEAALKILDPVLQKLLLGRLPERWVSMRLLENSPALEEKISAFLGLNLRSVPELSSALDEASALLQQAGITPENLPDYICTDLMKRAEELSENCVVKDSSNSLILDRKLDRLFTSRLTGYPVMLLLLAFVFWLTIIGANYPSQLLSALLFHIQDLLTVLFQRVGAPAWLHGALILGGYRCLAWVVSVMLPPMAIFFPLFTLLEDSGYLPRIAYNLDHTFQRCCSCGKQGLTMCMGFGCNAVGVTGCRIIDSPREQLIAILTNSLVPCNGRFPALLALITMFFAGTATGLAYGILSASLLTLVILLGIGMTFVASWLLSRTILKGMPSAFTLELPPYRRPQVGKVLIRSLFDRTLFVLGRAVKTAVPAGLLIWIFANVTWQGESLLQLLASALDPAARLFGLDGVILLAFTLGLPANEIVLPIMLMTYLQQSVLMEPGNLSALRELLLAQGWTWVTALCTLLFTLFHWPCATTLLTIHKETGSKRLTLLAALLPTAIGLGLCFLVNVLSKIL